MCESKVEKVFPMKQNALRARMRSSRRGNCCFAARSRAENFASEILFQLRAAARNPAPSLRMPMAPSSIVIRI